MAPMGTLPSIKAFIQMVWVHHGDNINNFKGFSHNNVCCKPTGGSSTVRGQ